MPISGRSLRISRNGTNVAGARTDNFTINNDPIDITDKDATGWRVLLADSATRTVSCDVEGIFTSTALVSEITGSGTLLIKSCVITVAGIGTFTGNFMLTNIKLGADENDAITFTASMESSGSMTTTIGPYNTVLPAITGTTTVGQTLTTTNGTWAGDATITYARQWQMNSTNDPNSPNWSDIASATALTYVLVSGQLAKYVRCRVIATNSVGSTTSYSNIVGPIA